VGGKGSYEPTEPPLVTGLSKPASEITYIVSGGALKYYYLQYYVTV